MLTLPSLTQEQADKLLTFYKTAKSGTTTYLDPSDTSHQSIIEIMLTAAGRSKAEYPHLFNALYTSGPYNGTGDIDHVHLVDAGQTAAGKATATIWSSSGTDTVIKSGHLLVFDEDTNKLLAQGENTSVKSGFLTCPVRGATALKAGKKLAILYVGHATAADGSARFFSFTKSMAVATDGIQVNITDPLTRKGNKNINIAVGRTINNGIPNNTDYAYIETTTSDNPNLVVPFTGTVPLGGTIDLSLLNIQALQTIIYVNDSAVKGNGTPIYRASQFTSDAAMLAGLSIYVENNIPVPNVLQINYPYDGLGHQATRSIVYNNNTLVNEQESYFYFEFNGIPYDDGTYSDPFWVCSIDSNEDRSINCTTVLNLYFWWHCLAKGTLVTLEDGSKKPIEDINDTFRVNTGTGKGSLAVWATVLGHHKAPGAESKEIFKLTTANGKSIIATENHMVFMSADKCRPISHLVKGDSIVTDEGISTVATNDPIAYDGMFYNLALGSLAEKADPAFPLNKANFYAGGILCGDQDAMRHNIKSLHEDLSYILPHIHSSLHADYTAAVNDKRF